MERLGLEFAPSKTGGTSHPWINDSRFANLHIEVKRENLECSRAKDFRASSGEGRHLGGTWRGVMGGHRRARGPPSTEAPPKTYQEPPRATKSHWEGLPLANGSIVQ